MPPARTDLRSPRHHCPRLNTHYSFLAVSGYKKPLACFTKPFPVTLYRDRDVCPRNLLSHVSDEMFEDAGIYGNL